MMRNLFLLLILCIGLAVYGYIDLKKHALAEAEAVRSAQKLEASERGLDEALTNLRATKSSLDRRTEEIAKLEEAKKNELADLQGKLTEMQTKLEEAEKKMAEATPDDSKKPMAELEELRTKLAAAESALVQAKTEATAALAQAAAKAAEAQRLQQLQARPPLGGAMEKRR